MSFPDNPIEAAAWEEAKRKWEEDKSAYDLYKEFVHSYAKAKSEYQNDETNTRNINLKRYW